MAGSANEGAAAANRDKGHDDKGHDKERKEKVEQTRATNVEDKEFKDWAAKQPKPKSDDRDKGNRLPPDPPSDLAAPREPGTAEPQGV